MTDDSQKPIRMRFAGYACPPSGCVCGEDSDQTPDQCDNGVEVYCREDWPGFNNAAFDSEPPRYRGIYKGRRNEFYSKHDREANT